MPNRAFEIVLSVVACIVFSYYTLRMISDGNRNGILFMGAMLIVSLLSIVLLVIQIKSDKSLIKKLFQPRSYFDNVLPFRRPDKK